MVPTAKRAGTAGFSVFKAKFSDGTVVSGSSVPLTPLEQRMEFGLCIPAAAGSASGNASSVIGVVVAVADTMANVAKGACIGVFWVGLRGCFGLRDCFGLRGWLASFRTLACNAPPARKGITPLPPPFFCVFFFFFSFCDLITGSHGALL